MVPSNIQTDALANVASLLTELIVTIKGRPATYAEVNYDFSGMWDPGEFHKLQDILLAETVLRRCQKMQLYRSDQELIFVFLTQNKAECLLHSLTEDELSDLNYFIRWLREYTGNTRKGYREEFHSMCQKSGSYKMFFIRLKSIYICTYLHIYICTNKGIVNRAEIYRKRTN